MKNLSELLTEYPAEFIALVTVGSVAVVNHSQRGDAVFLGYVGRHVNTGGIETVYEVGTDTVALASLVQVVRSFAPFHPRQLLSQSRLYLVSGLLDVPLSCLESGGSRPIDVRIAR